MNAKHRLSLIVIGILLAVSPWLAARVLAEDGGGPFRIFLPIISKTGEPTLADLIRVQIEGVLTDTGNPLNLTIARVDFNGQTLTLDFSTPTTGLSDSAEFETLLGQLDIPISQLLREHQSALNFEYEIFINGLLLFDEPPAATSASAPAVPAQPAGIAGKLIVLSPGHGYYSCNSAWCLERGYHWGIVEDFINADLITELYGLLAGHSADIRAARAVDRTMGDHASGHPWWQMGAGEYVRSLGAPGSVWGSGYSSKDRNIVAPPEYANWVGADMLVSVHNNGANGSARGTLTMYDTSNGHQEQSRRLAELIQNKLIERLHSQWDPNWYSFGARGYNGNYGENRRFNGPAVIVELAFMDNQSDNAALQNAAFRTIAMTAIRDAILEYYNDTTPPSDPPHTFIGNPVSRLYFDQNGERINLEVCADNLPGQTVHAQLTRPNRTFNVTAQTANGRCVTFWDMDGAGPVLRDTAYTTRAALNQTPNLAWPIPCYASTGGRGLCDTATLPAAPPPTSTVFTNGVSRLYFDQNGNRINLEVCADNLPGQTVSARLSRPGRTFDVISQVAANHCVTFWDMDGMGAVLYDTTYTTRAALNQIPNDVWPVPCMGQTGGQGLCDNASLPTPAAKVFTNGVSRLYFDQAGNRINLEVCADNLPGQTVYTRLSRPGRIFEVVSQIAASSCVTFWDLDGTGAVLYNTIYTTRAALNQPPNDTWPVPCAAATNGQGLCDNASLPNVFAGGASTLYFDQSGGRLNLQVCANNLSGQTIYAQLSRPGRVFDVVSLTATGNCVTFWDMDGAGAVLFNTPYTTRAALNQFPGVSWPVPCAGATGGQGLCDTAQYP